MPYVKQGRFIDFGFEPCANAFFDFYVTPKYIDPPLLELQDISFFLFLRKNVNPSNPSWKMPSIRQMQRRLDVSWRKLDAMMTRLEKARLLEKVSGFRAGENEANIPNDYLLSDPYPTLQEFLSAFRGDLKEQWKKYADEMYPDCILQTGVRESEAHPDREEQTLKQTNIKQIGELEEVWLSVLDSLKQQLPQATYYGFVADTELVCWEEGTATIKLANKGSRDWMEHQLSKQIKWLLMIEGKETHNLSFV